MRGEYNLDLKEGVDFKVKRGHWLPTKLGIECIAFRKTLYCRTADGEVPQHEFLHIVQFSRYGVGRVVFHYLFHVGKNFCRFGNLGKAFREVPFEVEARDFEAGQLAVVDRGDPEGADRLDLRPARPPATWIVKARIVVAFSLCAVLSLLGFTAMLMVACLTLFQARRFYAEVMARRLSLAALWLFGVRIERRPHQFVDRQTVFISNHTSMLDMFVIIALGLPNSRYFLSGFLREKDVWFAERTTTMIFRTMLSVARRGAICNNGTSARPICKRGELRQCQLRRWAKPPLSLTCPVLVPGTTFHAPPDWPNMLGAG